MVSIGNGEGKTLATLPGFCSGVRFTVAKARDGGLITEGLRSGSVELNFPATTMARNARGWRLAAMCFPPVAKNGLAWPESVYFGQAVCYSGAIIGRDFGKRETVHER
jgi:hypothetical protein